MADLRFVSTIDGGLVNLHYVVSIRLVEQDVKNAAIYLNMADGAVLSMCEDRKDIIERRYNELKNELSEWDGVQYYEY